jgi:hypothetical protein
MSVEKAEQPQNIGLFEEGVRSSRGLSEEQQRHVRENMTEEELVTFNQRGLLATQHCARGREGVERRVAAN